MRWRAVEGVPHHERTARSVRTCRPTATASFRSKPRARCRCTSRRAMTAAPASAGGRGAGPAGGSCRACRATSRSRRSSGRAWRSRRRGPGLTLLFRPMWRARPLSPPSLVPAVMVLMVVLAGVLTLQNEGRHAAARVRPQAGPVLERPGASPRAPEDNPLFPSAAAYLPRTRTGDPMLPQLLAVAGGEQLLHGDRGGARRPRVGSDADRRRLVPGRAASWTCCATSASCPAASRAGRWR